jgi:hypothetical protein
MKSRLFGFFSFLGAWLASAILVIELGHPTSGPEYGATPVESPTRASTDALPGV